MSSVASTTAQVSVLSSTTTTATITPLLVTPDSNKSFNDHKNDDSIDDRQLNKQNTNNKTYTRGNSNKSKQLTRSHAMKESASPPRTPNSHSPTALTLTTDVNHETLATIPSTSPTSALLTAPTFVLPLSDDASGASGKSQLDIEFPKLTPPKTKIWTTSAPQMGNRSNGRKSVSSDTSSNNNSLSEDNCESHNVSNEKQRSMHNNSSSNNSNNNQSNYCDSKDGDCDKSMSTIDNYSHDDLTLSPIVGQCKSPNFNDNNNNYNHNQKSNQYTVKGKPPLKNMGSSSSFDGGNNSSGFISRDSSSEQFVDQNGIDLVQFFKETLNKNAKDRHMLMKIERDMLQLSVDQTGRTFVKFPAMSSYNRMLVHRTAAYFGMEHNVDGTQQSVIASVSKDTRIPEIRFKTLIRDTFTEEPRKSILKRESHSFEDYLKGGLLTVHRGILSRKAKSFEEREEEYEKVRRRIFRNREMYGGHESMDEQEWQWFQSERSEMSSKLKVPHHRMLKMHSTSVDGRYGERNPSVSKSHSFGGYGGNNNNNHNNNNNNNHVPGANGTLMRDDSITSTKSAGPRLHKQDSATSTTWRLSPSSSGYKTQSIRSDSVTPSPTGYGSDTPEPSTTSPDSSVMWAVTDMANVPVGSLIIDPQTLQPMKNQDGTVYHFDPTNPPTNNTRNALTGSRKKLDRQRSLSHKNSSRDSSINNNTNSNSNSDTEKSTNMHPNVTTNTITNNVDYSIKNNQTDNCSTGDYEDNNCETSICSQEPFNTKEINENNASQIETNSQSIVSQNHLKPDEMMSSPMLKHQATSPNLPLNEITINEDEESTIPSTSIIQPIIEEEVCVEEIKKEESIIPIATTTIVATPSPVQEIRFQTNHHYANAPTTAVAAQPPPMPIMGYAQAPASYPLDPSAAVYNQSIPYQAPDGTLYVLSQQPMMYSYAPTTETDMSSYMVPVYDQNAMQPRDPNVTMMPVSYQQSPATATYNGTTLYQSPMVFSSDQFPNQPAPGSVAQYPMTYPMGYPMTYPVNGSPYQNYWPQPMTYFIPQAQPTGAPPTPNSHMIQSVTTSAHNTSTNTATTGHRRTSQLAAQQQHHQQQHQNGALQSFPSSVPLPLATASQADPNTPTNTPQATMYALPPTMYPNVLPYAAPQPFYQTMPHPQPNAIISSVIPAHPAHATANSNGNVHHAYTPTGNFQATEVLTHFPFNPQTHNNSNNNMNNSASTPHSAPSTPLSLTTVPPNFNKNPPLFATPPILTASGTTTGSYVQHHHDNSNNTYEKRNGSGFGGPKKYINNNNSNNNNNNHNIVQMIHATPVTPTTTTTVQHVTQPQQSATTTKIGMTTRQNSYGATASVTSQGKSSFNNNNNNNYNSEDNNSSSLSNSNNNSSNNYNSNRLKNNNNNNYQTTSQTNSYQPKTFVPAALKMQQQQQSANNSGSNTNSSGNSPNSNDNNNTESKYQPAQASRGPPRIPPSLDLKRNSSSHIINAHHHHHQQRSTPSTNSNESSNQSPNSITSYDHSRTYHYPQYQQATGGGHFYRGNSAGSTHHNSGGGDSTPIPTCFPFNVHQNAGASTPLIDSCHHQLISAYNPMAAGMYVKWNGHSAFSFANPSSIALPNNRKSPSNDIRPPLTPLTGVYSTMMMPGGPRQLNPRTMHNNPNYKNNRTQR